MVKNEGCSFGNVTRNMVENLNNETRAFHEEIKREFKELRETNATLYNHLSSRLPPWATAVGAIGISLLSITIGILVGGKI